MTLSARRGGGNISENIRNGFVSWIHSKGYGFAECDDDEIEDSFIPPNLIEKHELSANDEIRYIVGKSRGKDAVLEILSINNSVVITKEKIIYILVCTRYKNFMLTSFKLRVYQPVGTITKFFNFSI